MAARTKGKEAVAALGISGSPRRGGNTDVLVAEVLAGAAEAGAKTAKKRLADLAIGPCRGCCACVRTGKCVQDDGMTDLLSPMEKSGVWVLGSPLYWWGPTAQFKAFVDRWFGAIRKFPFKGKKVVLVMPLGDTDPSAASHAIGMLRRGLDYVGAEITDVILGPGLGDKGDARKNVGVLRKARHAGAHAVRMAAKPSQSRTTNGRE